jgi:hypothetical protein
MTGTWNILGELFKILLETKIDIHSILMFERPPYWMQELHCACDTDLRNRSYWPLE